MNNRSGSEDGAVLAATASELNNLLQIIGGTIETLEEICHDLPSAERHLAVLRLSVDRASKATEQIIHQIGGTEEKIVLHPAFRRRQAGSIRLRPPLRVAHSVLVLDDEPLALELAKQTLSRAGFSVTAASSGAEALELFARQPERFDLVLMDLNMPLMDGEEVFVRLREIDPKIRVLLNSGFVDQARLQHLMANGLAGFLRRPYRPDEMVAQIRSIISNGGEAAIR